MDGVEASTDLPPAALGEIHKIDLNRGVQGRQMFLMFMQDDG